jgi:hypothetical protein
MAALEDFPDECGAAFTRLNFPHRKVSNAHRFNVHFVEGIHVTQVTVLAARFSGVGDELSARTKDRENRQANLEENVATRCGESYSGCRPMACYRDRCGRKSSDGLMEGLEPSTR